MHTNVLNKKTKTGVAYVQIHEMIFVKQYGVKKTTVLVKKL